MKIPTRRLSVAHIGLASILALATLPVSAPSAAAAAGELLPDMLMAAPYNVTIQVKSNGTRLLRFGTIVWNVGLGPLEVRARNRVGNTMTRVSQRITTTTGVVNQLVPGMTAFYSGDGHNHWHVARFIDVSLTPQAGASESVDERHLRKIGFCLVDLVRAPAALRPANSVAVRKHWVSGCGNRQSKQLRFGISVGWGDDYRPFFAYQQINISGLPDGAYRLCATVNPEGLWREAGAGAANNSYWFDVQLAPSTAALTPIAQGLGPCSEAAPAPSS